MQQEAQSFLYTCCHLVEKREPHTLRVTTVEVFLSPEFVTLTCPWDTSRIGWLTIAGASFHSVMSAKLSCQVCRSQRGETCADESNKAMLFILSHHDTWFLSAWYINTINKNTKPGRAETKWLMSVKSLQIFKLITLKWIQERKRPSWSFPRLSAYDPKTLLTSDVKLWSYETFKLLLGNSNIPTFIIKNSVAHIPTYFRNSSYPFSNNK